MTTATGAASAHLESIFSKACRLDVIAFKPGNVSLWAGGHGMSAQDFFDSAKVAVPLLCAKDWRVGQRIEAAVEATIERIGCNTNLGIILLLAPLAVAAATGARSNLREHVAATLANLQVSDSECCFRAIRRANPAGLGDAAEQDVKSAPTLDLKTTMALAATEDSIAAQYANDYSAIFTIGVPTLIDYRKRWRSLAWATTACYLTLLSATPDSHIRRKWGTVVAQAISAQAGSVVKALKACENPRLLVGRLFAFDRELKARGVNPGTSADLTVASVAALLLQERFQRIFD